MASVTSTGLGSGLDVEAIVSQLISAERSAADTRISRLTARANYSLSALGSVKSALATFQTAAQKLLPGASLSSHTASSSNTALATVSASTDAVSGSYGVEVVKLAKAQKQVSGTFSGSDAVVGAGTMSFASTSGSFSVTMNADSTLANLRDAINQASDNVGVSASLINEDGGTRLVLTSTKTGEDNAITVSGSLATFTETQAAQNAEVKVEGYTHTSASNTVSDAIEGVTLNLLAAEEGTTFSVTVNNDTSSALSAVRSFVSAYNSVVSTIAGNSGYDATSQTAGALIGDSLTRSVSSQLRNILSKTVPAQGDYSSLSQLGLSLQKDGSLSLDTGKFNDAMAADAGAVQRLFGDETNGFAQQFDEALDQFLDKGDNGFAPFDYRIDTLNQRLTDLSKETARVDARMAIEETRYRAQFSALDAIVSQYQNTQSYLTQMFNSNNSSNN